MHRHLYREIDFPLSLTLGNESSFSVIRARACMLLNPPGNTLFVLLISHQPAVLFSQNKPATSNQPAVLFSQNKSAPAIGHQSNEEVESC
jgi:hypothetical protein